MYLENTYDYSSNKLSKSELQNDPFTVFEEWIVMAKENNIKDYNAFHLATSSTDGIVSGRIVLLKEIQNGQFVFFTNYHSLKGKQLDNNPMIAATFFWSGLERQVRIEGIAERIDSKISKKYFENRTKKSQAVSIISNQSVPVKSRKELENKFESILATDKPLTRPNHWGGYAITPHMFEFWQGRPNRLNDRILFTFDGNNWKKERLQP